MSIRIENNSVSVYVHSYALARIEDREVVVWIEFSPQHPKVIGAIWASMVNGGAHEPLSLFKEDGSRITVHGLGHRYERREMESPNLAGRGKGKPKFVRMIAPEAARIAKIEAGFYVLSCWGLPLGMTLAAMLENDTRYPMRLGWGEYLLAAAERDGFAKPLTTGGSYPLKGYHLHGNTPWPALISEGVKSGSITLDGKTVAIPTQIPTPIQAETSYAN